MLVSFSIRYKHICEAKETTKQSTVQVPRRSHPSTLKAACWGPRWGSSVMTIRQQHVAAEFAGTDSTIRNFLSHPARRVYVRTASCAGEGSRTRKPGWILSSAQPASLLCRPTNCPGGESGSGVLCKEPGLRGRVSFFWRWLLLPLDSCRRQNYDRGYAEERGTANATITPILVRI